MRSCLAIVMLLALAPAVIGDAAAQDESVMNNRRLDRLIRQIDGIEGEIQGRPGFWQFDYQGYQIYIITDERADRMRIMTPIVAADAVRKDALYRVLQANFDTALDARYAIAQGALWSAFLHPLAELSDDAFYAGFAQTVALAATYGTTYSSSGLGFSGGDSTGQ